MNKTFSAFISSVSHLASLTFHKTVYITSKMVLFNPKHDFPTWKTEGKNIPESVLFVFFFLSD